MRLVSEVKEELFGSLGLALSFPSLSFPALPCPAMLVQTDGLAMAFLCRGSDAQELCVLCLSAVDDLVPCFRPGDGRETLQDP